MQSQKTKRSMGFWATLMSSNVYFLAASILFGSRYLALATVTLGVGHLVISFQEFRDLQDRP
jgi:hypothetical protein